MRSEVFPRSFSEITVLEAYIIFRFRTDIKIRCLLNDILALGLPDEAVDPTQEPKKSE